MAKANIKRPDGTLISIEGSSDEIKKILTLYSDDSANRSFTNFSTKKVLKGGNKADQIESAEDIVIKIVQEIKNGEKAEKIETNILEQSSQVDRVLLPLYIAKKYIGDVKMTSGDIYLVLQQLGIKMLRNNISKTLAKTGLKYVMKHRKRKQDGKIPYTLALKGEKYISSLLE